jgi:hypothetical protein
LNCEEEKLRWGIRYAMGDDRDDVERRAEKPRRAGVVAIVCND